MKFLIKTYHRNKPAIDGAHQEEIQVTQAEAVKTMAARDKGLQNWLAGGENHRMEIRSEEYRNEAYILRELKTTEWFVDIPSFEQLKAIMVRRPGSEVRLYEDNKTFFELHLKG